MTITELAILLDENNIPISSYSLNGGLYNDKLCLDKTHYGWIVYYCERGKKYEEVGFPSEDNACIYFYKRIREMTGAF